ncbi:MAG: 3-keto-5-aminohexanoate cleavage protein, partial [Hyphomicrobiales bacterium]|nr:3-keto-5-aminohexanoate cleavage protein [Hyphomicrobiales bacterium]
GGAGDRGAILMCAPNGARRTKADHPALPMTAAEIAADAEHIAEAGAAAIHLHVRNPQGGHSLDAGLYREAISAIRERIGDRIVIQATTEAVGLYTPAEQVAVARALTPESISIALREIAPTDDDLDAAADFLAFLFEAGVTPQIILYDAEDVIRFRDFVASGRYPFATPFVLFVLGRYAKDQLSAPGDLDPFLAAMGEDIDTHAWMVCAFGRREAEIAEHVLAHGGHMRIGFENNLWRGDGSLLADNAESVGFAAAAVDRVGRRVVDADTLRASFTAWSGR